MPIYLMFIKGVLSVEFGFALRTYRKGAPFHNASVLALRAWRNLPGTLPKDYQPNAVEYIAPAASIHRSAKSGNASVGANTSKQCTGLIIALAIRQHLALIPVGAALPGSLRGSDKPGGW